MSAPNNGSISSADFGTGSSVTFECDDGFYLAGESVLTCSEVDNQQQGVWDYVAPICRSKCYSLSLNSFVCFIAWCRNKLVEWKSQKL